MSLSEEIYKYLNKNVKKSTVFWILNNILYVLNEKKFLIIKNLVKNSIIPKTFSLNI